MSEINPLPKPPDPPKRKPYQKPVIEKVNLVPNEAVLGSVCTTDLLNPDCYIGYTPMNL